MSSFQIVVPEFLPSVTYFMPFLKSEIIIIADHIQYQKRSTLTRRNIRNNLQLTIPVKKGHTKTIRQKEIAYSENWDRKHLTRLHHIFHMYPFFDEYFVRLEEIYLKGHQFLIDFLYEHLHLFTSLLKINCKIKLASREGFNNSLEDSLIHFAKNSRADFLYNSNDINNGYINLSKLKQAKVKTNRLSENKGSSFNEINILEFFFENGPETAFLIREQHRL